LFVAAAVQLRSVTAKDALRLQKEQGYTILDVRLESDFEEVKNNLHILAVHSSSFLSQLLILHMMNKGNCVDIIV
jgi:hypothetical protein